MPKIQLITTGGTISMSKDRNGKSIPAISGIDLLNNLTETQQEVQWEVLNFSNIGSCHMSPDKMLALGVAVQNCLKDPSLQGIIITHGTDTLEETAYFLDLIIDDHRPIILTASQRDTSEIDTDGPRNLKDSMLITLDSLSIGRGTMICFNEEIHAARDIRKVHTSQINAFSSGKYGILGSIDDNKVLWYRNPAPSVKFPTPHALANIHICKAYTGMTDASLKFLNASNIEGLVIEAFGRGNIPPHIVPFVEETVSRGLPVVITSRCQTGNTAPIYGYFGGGAELEKVGVWFAQDLSTEKVRLLMCIGLGSGLSNDELKQIISQGGIQPPAIKKREFPS